MAKITNTLESSINAIKAENPELSDKDMKIIYIKNGGTILYPCKSADGKLSLGKMSFRHASVLADREVKSAEHAKIKAERDAAKALKHAQELAAKAQARALAAQEKAQALAQPKVEATADTTVTA